jgi:hypothetical protein
MLNRSPFPVERIPADAIRSCSLYMLCELVDTVDGWGHRGAGCQLPFYDAEAFIFS